MPKRKLSRPQGVPGLGERMRTALKLLGQPMRQIARELGFGEATITACFRHQNPQAVLLLAVAKRTGVSVDWLLTGKGDYRAPRRAESDPDPDAGRTSHIRAVQK